MNTSLGNGFSNLMFAEFVAWLHGCKIVIAIEGDDGLARVSGKILTSGDFAQLGLTIKLEIHDRLETASFCGIIFDEEEEINIRDPRTVLCTFGWGSKKYIRSKQTKLKALLRCKALSTAYEYPGCPIISALADYGLRMTRGVRYDAMKKVAYSMNMYQRDVLFEAIKDEHNIPRKSPGPRSRDLVSRLYGIDIKTQISIEEYLDTKNDLGPLMHSSFVQIMPDVWNRFDSIYTRTVYETELDKQHFATDGKDHCAVLLEIARQSVDIDKRFVRLGKREFKV